MTAAEDRERLGSQPGLLAGASVTDTCVEAVVAITAGVAAGPVTLVGSGLDLAGRESLRPGRPLIGPVTAVVAVGGLTAALLARMRRELLQDERLSGPTVTAMYGAYTLHGLVVGVSAWRRSVHWRPRTVAVGLPLTAAGSGLVVAGMSRFVSAGQVNGTQVGELATGGVYRLSRNPQYSGYVLALTGLGLTRRSGAVLALAAGAGAVFAWWVPVEERALRRGFGVPYERYLARTPRWLGPPRRRGSDG